MGTNNTKKVCVEVDVSTIQKIGDLCQSHDMKVKEAYNFVLEKGIKTITAEESGVSVVNLCESIDRLETKVDSLKLQVDRFQDLVKNNERKIKKQNKKTSIKNKSECRLRTLFSKK